jgi:hypothetical protein
MEEEVATAVPPVEAPSEAVAPDALPDVGATPPGVSLLAELGTAVSDPQATKRQRSAAIIKGLKRGGVVSACTALLYWVLLSPPVAMSTFYNHVLFVPTRFPTQTKSIAGFPIERVTFSALNGKKLTGWYIHNPHATKTILFSHGKRRKYGLVCTDYGECH